jgi:hypothetical protein
MSTYLGQNRAVENFLTMDKPVSILQCDTLQTRVASSFRSIISQSDTLQIRFLRLFVDHRELCQDPRLLQCSGIAI